MTEEQVIEAIKAGANTRLRLYDWFISVDRAIVYGMIARLMYRGVIATRGRRLVVV